MPDLRHLRYFLAAADELNFTRAARRVGVSQQVVGAQIRRLEEELGVQLFDRSSHHVALTDAGEALAQRGREVYASVEALWEDARLRGNGAGAVLRFGFARSGTYDTTPRLIAAMRDQHPDVEVVGIEVSSAELPRALLDGRVDIATMHWHEDVGGLFLRALRRLRQGIVVKRQDDLGRRPEVELEVLSGRPLLLPRASVAPARHKAIMRSCREAGFEPTVVTSELPFDPSFPEVAADRGIAIAVETVRSTLPRSLTWVALADGVLSVSATLAWDPARACPARDLLLSVADRVAHASGWDRTLAPSIGDRRGL